MDCKLLSDEDWTPVHGAPPMADNNGWLPIETAPKDGTEVQLYGVWCSEIHQPIFNQGRMEIDKGRWEGGKCDHPGEGWWELTSGAYYQCWMKPTHWRPMPEPPTCGGMES